MKFEDSQLPLFLHSRLSKMDISRIETNQISGLDLDEMVFMENLIGSTEDIIFNQWTGLPTNIEEQQLHVHMDESDECELSNEQMNEILNLENSAKSANTERQTKNYIKMLKTFLEKNKLPSNIETLPARYLESYLRLFY